MSKLFKRIAPLLLAMVMVLGSCLTVSAAGSSTLEDCLNNDFAPYREYLDSHRDANFPFVGVLGGKSSSTYSITKVYVSNVPFMEDSTSGSNSATYICLYPGYIDESAKYYELSLVDGVVSKGNVITLGSNTRLYGVSGRVTPFLVSNYALVVSGSESEYKAVLSEYADFFPGPAPLVAAVMKVEPEKTLKEVILLIPLSVLFLAGCLGLRKGLRYLSSILRRA